MNSVFLANSVLLLTLTYNLDLEKGYVLNAVSLYQKPNVNAKTTLSYLATVHVQSAFDVVQHLILHDKTLDRNIHPDLWFVIKDLYSGLTSKVKWQGELSDSFNILQGVRQGGILSTHLYKIFVEDLLVELEKKTGFSLGDIYCGTPTCADDIALISSNPAELQIMLNTIGRYANQHHYNITQQNRKSSATDLQRITEQTPGTYQII
ncbi:Hypothetical predicted protein [Mytilus galloprovincialis]|uniref:Reverse transcriptase domain-containing protein n=1 Tax=Mytilus galloprovincialis TaxID=29158 RepID=A0A8B6G531_MYTGA|nr:Hypothetical predicted protein [Mytilus galloprovincialis]